MDKRRRKQEIIEHQPVGCTSDPFILNATLEKHLESYMGEKGNTKIITRIKNKMFVDNSTLSRLGFFDIK